MTSTLSTQQMLWWPSVSKQVCWLFLVDHHDEDELSYPLHFLDFLCICSLQFILWFILFLFAVVDCWFWQVSWHFSCYVPLIMCNFLLPHHSMPSRISLYPDRFCPNFQLPYALFLLLLACLGWLLFWWWGWHFLHIAIPAIYLSIWNWLSIWNCSSIWISFGSKLILLISAIHMDF